MLEPRVEEAEEAEGGKSGERGDTSKSFECWSRQKTQKELSTKMDHKVICYSRSEKSKTCETQSELGKEEGNVADATSGNCTMYFKQRANEREKEKERKGERTAAVRGSAQCTSRDCTATPSLRRCAPEVCPASAHTARKNPPENER